ncbi:MAG: tRNA epoxyqueuosine(34) reductase QueG [Gammaproteobacteria bacterium]|nr:tRNA epoxyqueuosine(34) reductase QueG [Gammaproteobacteria bacterium]
MSKSANSPAPDYRRLTERIKAWGVELGFAQVGISGTDLADDEKRLQTWLARDYHGSMNYMAAHGVRRSRPAALIPGTLSIISVRLDYTDTNALDGRQRLMQSDKAYVSRYAVGRDYHKVLRSKLKALARQISAHCESYSQEFAQRVFVDSAPVLEKALARNAGLGWIGKHTNLINKNAGSWFFLGELFTNLPLVHDQAATEHCGSCTICLDVCPTAAIVAPYEVDARRCISYLTIENKGEIPASLRNAIGNRIYGCDDCQLFCPWNKFANAAVDDDFAPRHQLDSADLVTLFAWSAADFDKNTRGSAIRRAGYTGWLRNIAVALGNAPTTATVIAALHSREKHASPLVREHVQWALAQHAGNGHNGSDHSNAGSHHD